MIVFGFDIEEYEYAYRLTAPDEKMTALRPCQDSQTHARSLMSIIEAVSIILLYVTAPVSHTTTLTGETAVTHRFPWRI